MNESLSLAPALAVGVLLGAVFFGGLWWTLRLGLASQRPALWFLGSLLARMSVALLGFYFVGGDQWERWLLCLLGFILSRFVVQRGWRARQAGDAT